MEITAVTVGACQWERDQFETRSIWKKNSKNAFFAAKHFVFFVCPILLKLGMEKNDPSTNGRTRRENVFWYLAFFSSQCVKAKTINSHLMRPSSVGLRVFFSGCGFEFLWCFSRQRWKLSPSATHMNVILCDPSSLLYKETVTDTRPFSIFNCQMS